MADYIYLLENRLAPAQKSALRLVREVAASKGLTIFLVGGAVRDLTSGSPVRDLDVVVQGNASKLRKELEKAGASISGELDGYQALFLRFAGGVRMEFSSALSITFPKPGKAVARPASILEDLRRRDFTANAMALSLNEGSYGLLMDPLNGVADIENRQLRLVSPYGFIEDPIRMVRAARLMARLGWTLEERTENRYNTGKEEGYISVMNDFQRGYELEEIVHEEDPLRVLRRLETENWMHALAPFWSAAKVNVAELERMRDVQTQLQMQGILPDASAANFPLLTAKLSQRESASLLESFPRKGFVEEIQALEAEAKDFAGQLGSKAAAVPSVAWKLLVGARPEVVLWTVFSNRNAAIQSRFKSFSGEWPQARQRVPYALMQEMRIVPNLPGYNDLLETIFFELMDGRLATQDEMKAFLEPHSPPAPPPPVNLRRPRAAKKEGKASKARAKKAAQAEVVGDGETAGVDEGSEGAKSSTDLQASEQTAKPTTGVMKKQAAPPDERKDAASKSAARLTEAPSTDEASVPQRSSAASFKAEKKAPVQSDPGKNPPASGTAKAVEGKKSGEKPGSAKLSQPAKEAGAAGKPAKKAGSGSAKDVVAAKGSAIPTKEKKSAPAPKAGMKNTDAGTKAAAANSNSSAKKSATSSGKLIPPTKKTASKAVLKSKSSSAGKSATPGKSTAVKQSAGKAVKKAAKKTTGRR